ncbi:hypothetical protein FGB62_1g6111 [Gracilaria domingensis]|nr:hypothetical protein FGB62_1g6111 [Gracilaria domingensis]
MGKRLMEEDDRAVGHLNRKKHMQTVKEAACMSYPTAGPHNSHEHSEQSVIPIAQMDVVARYQTQADEKVFLKNSGMYRRYATAMGKSVLELLDRSRYRDCPEFLLCL